MGNPRRHIRTRKHRGGSTARHSPPSLHAPACGAQLPLEIAPTCSPPVDVSPYKNPCALGSLPLDTTFSGTPMRGGRAVNRSQKSKTSKQSRRRRFKRKAKKEPL